MIPAKAGCRLREINRRRSIFRSEKRLGELRLIEVRQGESRLGESRGLDRCSKINQLMNSSMRVPPSLYEGHPPCEIE